MTSDPSLVIEGVVITHPNRVIFPADGYTKLDLIDYYRIVAPYLLPFLRDRPLTLRPFPRGIEQPGYYLKNAPKGTPPWVPTRRDVAESTGRPVEWIVGGDLRTLLWIVNRSAIEVHPWLARIDEPDRPDWLVIDLDPAEETPFECVCEAAKLVKQRLDRLALRGLLKTTGQSGLHVLVPIAREWTFDAVRAFARQLAVELEQERPEVISTTYETARRRGCVLLDYAQNARARTTVAPYSVRARRGAPVSTPLRWEELDDPGLRSNRYTIRDVPKRLDALGDLLGPFLALEQRLPI